MKHILIKIPTRGRGFDLLKPYIDLHTGGASTHFLISTDVDDPTTEEVPDWLYQNATVIRGHSENKVDAINRDIAKCRTPWDVLVIGSDDMRPLIEGYDDILKEECPDNGVLWIPTEDSAPHKRGGKYMIPGSSEYLQNWISMFPVMSREYYNEFGYVYHPSYKSFWCDNEYTDVIRENRRYKFLNRQDIVKHEHPAWGGSVPNDDTYQKANAHWTQDQINYKKRKQ